jgi:hypothetical protein
LNEANFVDGHSLISSLAAAPSWRIGIRKGASSAGAAANRDATCAPFDTRQVRSDTVGRRPGAVKKPPCRQARATTDRTTQWAIYPEIRPVSESARARSAPRFGPSEASLVRRREVGWVRVCHFCARIDRARSRAISHPRCLTGACLANRPGVRCAASADIRFTCEVDHR